MLTRETMDYLKRNVLFSPLCSKYLSPFPAGGRSAGVGEGGKASLLLGRIFLSQDFTDSQRQMGCSHHISQQLVLRLG